MRTHEPTQTGANLLYCNQICQSATAVVQYFCDAEEFDCAPPSNCARQSPFVTLRNVSRHTLPAVRRRHAAAYQCALQWENDSVQGCCSAPVCQAETSARRPSSSVDFEFINAMSVSQLEACMFQVLQVAKAMHGCFAACLFSHLKHTPRHRPSMQFFPRTTPCEFVGAKLLLVR